MFFNCENKKCRSKGFFYILLSFSFWVVVEYITVWHKDFGGWVALMPWVFLQYLVIILVFYYFIFRRRWSERKVFYLMLGVMFGLELLWGNLLLLSVVWFVPGYLLLTSIWGFLTFMPLWIVNRSLAKRKRQAVCFCLWIVVALVMGLMTLVL
jgi:hypothetical protein